MRSNELQFLKKEIELKLERLIDEVDHIDQREALKKIFYNLRDINVWTVD